MALYIKQCLNKALKGCGGSDGNDGSNDGGSDSNGDGSGGNDGGSGNNHNAVDNKKLLRL